MKKFRPIQIGLLMTVTWLFNSAKEKVVLVWCFENHKGDWDTLKDVNRNKKNISKVFKLYERLFNNLIFKREPRLFPVTIMCYKAH